MKTFVWGSSRILYPHLQWNNSGIMRVRMVISSAKIVGNIGLISWFRWTVYSLFYLFIYFFAYSMFKAGIDES
jgi:hypothetical protein